MAVLYSILLLVLFEIYLWIMTALALIQDLPGYHTISMHPYVRLQPFMLKKMAVAWSLKTMTKRMIHLQAVALKNTKPLMVGKTRALKSLVLLKANPNSPSLSDEPPQLVV